MAHVGEELPFGLRGCQGRIARAFQGARLLGCEVSHGFGLFGLVVEAEHQLPTRPQEQAADGAGGHELEDPHADLTALDLKGEGKPPDERDHDHHHVDRKTVSHGRRGHDRDRECRRVAERTADREHGKPHAGGDADGGDRGRRVVARVVRAHAGPHQQRQRRRDRTDQDVRPVWNEGRCQEKEDRPRGVDERQDGQYVLERARASEAASARRAFARDEPSVPPRGPPKAAPVRSSPV